ncbi:hypothetical protein ACTOJ1_000757 [Shigella flexneri]
MKDRYKNYLKQIKKGDTVKVCIVGAGVASSPEKRVVEHVDTERNLLWLNGADGYYDKKSVYAYSLETGKTVSNYAPGFYAEIHL